MTDFKKALHDPSDAFNEPADVLKDGTLDTDQKLAILKQWKVDAHNLMVAEEENMPSNDDSSSMYHRVMEALDDLQG